MRCSSLVLCACFYEYESTYYFVRAGAVLATTGSAPQNSARTPRPSAATAPVRLPMKPPPQPLRAASYNIRVDHTDDHGTTTIGF